MSVITPTITTDDPHVYREQMEIISGYSGGVHLDFSDGVFSPSRLLPLGKSWRKEELITHIHLMYKSPLAQVEKIIKLGPDLVILHAESDDLRECLEILQEEGIRTGVALLPETSVSTLEIYGNLFDHVLVFGGRLGFQGGTADLGLLSKVKEIKKNYVDIEVSWDGGVNYENAKQIADAGVDILDVGSFLKNSEDPKKAYDKLSSLIQS